jgi:predicted transcriptional regulator
MAQTTVRVSEATREVLREIARTDGRPMQALLEEAVELLRRRRFLDAVNAGYAAYRADAEGWQEELADREAWDATLVDGLPAEAPPQRSRAQRAAGRADRAAEGPSAGGRAPGSRR